MKALILALLVGLAALLGSEFRTHAPEPVGCLPAKPPACIPIGAAVQHSDMLRYPCCN